MHLGCVLEGVVNTKAMKTLWQNDQRALGKFEDSTLDGNKFILAASCHGNGTRKKSG